MRGRVVDFNCTIGYDNGVRVTPGDLIFGDQDGVVVIPKEMVEDTVRLALEKVRGENRVARAIRDGMSTQEAWDRYGIM